MFATDNDRCPLGFFHLLLSKWPHDLQSSDPLYLHPLKKPKEDIWFSSQPVGENNLDTSDGNISWVDMTNKWFRNHSIRKNTIMKLQKAGVSNDRIVSITGHKNEQSFCDYTDVDMEDHAKHSEILACASTSTNKHSISPHSISLHKSPQNIPGPSKFNFTNYTVYIGSSYNTASSTLLNHSCIQEPKQAPSHNRVCVIDSDSDWHVLILYYL